MSGKLDARQVAWISPSTTKKNSSVALENGGWIENPTIHGKLILNHIYDCLEHIKPNSEEILLWGSHF